MKKYWFYGIMPKDIVEEENLSEEQKNIILEEKEKLSEDNYLHGWLGFSKNTYWEFMRHGFETITVNESRGNIARNKLLEVLNEKYGE